MKRHNDIQHNNKYNRLVRPRPRPKPKKGKPKPRPKKRPRPRTLHVKTQFSLSAMVSVEDNGFESK